MENKTDLIYRGSSAPTSTAIGKMKTALCQVLRYLLTGIGIVIIGVIAVPTVILMMIMGIWSFFDYILSILDQKKRAQALHEKHVDAAKKIKDAEGSET